MGNWYSSESAKDATPMATIVKNGDDTYILRVGYGKDETFSTVVVYQHYSEPTAEHKFPGVLQKLGEALGTNQAHVMNFYGNDPPYSLEIQVSSEELLFSATDANSCVIQSNALPLPIFAPILKQAIEEFFKPQEISEE